MLFLPQIQVRYERPKQGGDDTDEMEVYSQGEVIPREKIISAVGLKVRAEGATMWGALRK